MTRAPEHEGEPATVLLVEPDARDAELLLNTFRDANIANPVHTVETAVEALDFLHQRGDYGDAPRPNLVLLSTDLPDGHDGIDVLEEVKENEELRAIPVIAMADDADEKNVERAYEHHANAYVEKPVDADEFLDTARTLGEFWITINRLPPEPDEDDGHF